MNPSPPSQRKTRGPRRWRAPRGWTTLSACLLLSVPVVALGVPDRVRIPIVRDHGAGDPPDAALFSHWDHDTFTCVSCHPSTFPQRKVGFTHDDMNQGRFCGSCHDGRTAFGPKDKGVECETCHVPTKKREIDEDDLWK